MTEPSDGAGRAPHQPLRVLVVDDSDVVRELIAVNLRLDGFEVQQAADGLEALDRLASWLPDVVTLDVVMPRLGGFATAARLRADPGTAAIAIVMVTGRSQAADVARGESLGVDAYLFKPFEPAELVSTVRRLAEGGARRR